MKFPMTFKCGECDETHTSDFLAAFVLDTAGNWFFDLGEKKGWTGVTQQQYETLMDLFAQRTHLVCVGHLGYADVDRHTGERVFPGIPPLQTA